MITPDFKALRNGTTCELTFYNFNPNKTINVYLGEGELGVPQLEAEGIILSRYTINNLIATKNYGIIAAFATDNFDASFTIISEDANGYTLSPEPGVTYQQITEPLEIPWGEDVNIDYYRVDNLTQTEELKSRKTITIGEQQTL